MDRPVRFFECLLPVTVCNLKCHYCYVMQRDNRRMKMLEMKYSPEHIAYSLRKERVGGVCWISICGSGETLIQEECIEIVYNLLNEGHYVNITTNGTLSKRFDKLIEKCDGGLLNHLQVAFSMHYIELKKRNMLDAFFANVKKMRRNGASVLVQLNLCDEYIPFIDEIKEISLREIGAYPQVALTRDESVFPNKIYSNFDNKTYYKWGQKFNSPLFEFTFKNFNVKRREFCYAGAWSGVLNLQTGMMGACYANGVWQNIFEDPDKPIVFEAVGKKCGCDFCSNSSHFLSMGVIPSINAPTYIELRNRENANWYSVEMREFLGHKLSESHERYNCLHETFDNFSAFRLVCEVCQRAIQLVRIPARKLRILLKRSWF